MGGKSSTSTQQVSIPPQVLAQYSAVNARANQTAQTPFQSYGGQFVAPVNAEQTAGINQLPGLTTAADAANKTAMSTTQASGAPLTGSQIDQYLSPYLQTVLGSTANVLNQNNQQQQAGQLGNAINQGAFGGDRTGIAAANLEQQQNLANSQIYSGIANQGYQSALGTAQGQQQIGLAAGAQEAQIGQQQFNEGLQGAQAQIGAGTLEQQTQQAQDTALYNQFLQKQSYPFQVDQFLANIAEGTGALSGSTTTTTQPGGFFSDVRLKHDIKKIGKTYDNQSIYSYKMHGDPRTHIGLIAQDVEKKKPEAVGVASGFKTVDYGKATEKAADRGHFASGGGPYSPVGGLDSTALNIPTASGPSGIHLEGGGVVLPFFRRHRDAGGYQQSDYDLGAILGQQQAMYQRMQPMNYRGIPVQPNQQHQLAVANGSPAPRPSGASNLQQSLALGNDINQDYGKASKAWQNHQLNSVSNYEPTNSIDPNAFTPNLPAPDVPVAAPGSGVASGSAAAPTASGVAAGDAGATTASLAAPAADAATAAAADAGATAAGTAAASAGTAAAGAAGTAAAGAAADAAAAEVAADVLPLVALAHRGGRMGYDMGGGPYSGVAANSPYSSSTGNLDIPDEENTAKLQTAGALKKQPTGLQTLMTMANPDDASSIAGSLFSNQGLGSRRGGRIHKDGGGGLGSADPDINPQDVVWSGSPLRNNMGLPSTMDLSNSPPMPGKAPPIRSGVAASAPAPAPTAAPTPAPAPAPSGLAATDLSPVGVDPQADQKLPEPTDQKLSDVTTKKGFLDKVGDWWERNKTNAIPAIQGLAAMGMYPTKHLGVALAAGLGAGAQAYYPAQEAEQTVRGQDLQNQMQQARLDILKRPPPPGGGMAPPTAPTLNGIGIDPVSMSNNVKNRWAVQDIWQPQEQAALADNMQKSTAGFPNQLQTIQTLHNANLQNRKTVNEQSGGANYDALSKIAGAPAGTAIQEMAKVDPTDAAKLRQIAQNPQDADALARSWASQVGNNLYRYTGRGDPLVDTDGIARDKASRQPILGQIAVGYSAKDYGDYLLRRAGPVETGSEARPSLDQFSQATGRGLPAVPQPSVQIPGAAPAPAARAAPARGALGARPAVGATAPSAPAAPGAGGNPPAGYPGHIYPKDAWDFSDAPKPPPYVDNPGKAKSVDQVEELTDYKKDKQALFDESKLAQETQKEIIQIKRAQALLPNTTTGPWDADTKAALVTTLNNMTGVDLANFLHQNSAAYSTLETILGKKALEDGIADLKDRGAQIRLGSQESNLLVNTLAASNHMPREAIAAILGWGLQQGTYDLAKENAIPQYLAQGGDARQFANYYAQRFPLSNTLTTDAPPGTTLTSPRVTGTGRVGRPPVQVSSEADYNALPTGTPFVFNGRSGVKR